uniref:Uncharacterized protein n=1 Tax=Knipowitschia caucasica TaxID=637954 RepID=A0AAV2KMB8_KNICA
MSSSAASTDVLWGQSCLPPSLTYERANIRRSRHIPRAGVNHCSGVLGFTVVWTEMDLCRDAELRPLLTTLTSAAERQQKIHLRPLLIMAVVRPSDSSVSQASALQESSIDQASIRQQGPSAHITSHKYNEAWSAPRQSPAADGAYVSDMRLSAAHTPEPPSS